MCQPTVLFMAMTKELVCFGRCHAVYDALMHCNSKEYVCACISQDHPIITLSVAITGRVSTVVRVSKEPKQVLVELSHLKGCEDIRNIWKKFSLVFGLKKPMKTSKN